MLGPQRSLLSSETSSTVGFERQMIKFVGFWHKEAAKKGVRGGVAFRNVTGVRRVSWYWCIDILLQREIEVCSRRCRMELERLVKCY